MLILVLLGYLSSSPRRCWLQGWRPSDLLEQINVWAWHLYSVVLILTYINAVVWWYLPQTLKSHSFPPTSLFLLTLINLSYGSLWPKPRVKVLWYPSLKASNDATQFSADSGVSLTLNALNLTRYFQGWILISSALHPQWERGLTSTGKI